MPNVRRSVFRYVEDKNKSHDLRKAESAPKADTLQIVKQLKLNPSWVKFGFASFWIGCAELRSSQWR